MRLYDFLDLAYTLKINKLILFQFSFQNYELLRSQITSRVSQFKDDPMYKILIIGPVQSGKSSYINTVLSAMRKERIQMARSAPSDESVTKQVNKLYFDSLCTHNI